MLKTTIDATVTKVDAENAGAGTGYAAFRMANRNGRIGGAASARTCRVAR
ncbi:hypothetical protein SALBM217S_04872 [Streptomyces griseoloalbus]